MEFPPPAFILPDIIRCLSEAFQKGEKVTTHPFTIEIGVLYLLDHLCGPSCKRDLDGDEWIVTHCGH